MLNPETAISDCLETAFGLRKYVSILNEVSAEDFAPSTEFRKKFNGYYAVRQRSVEWYNKFYSLMVEQRDEPKSFVELLSELYSEEYYSGSPKIEVSFVSKMMATVNTNLPIWDKYVLINLELDNSWRAANNLPFDQRLNVANEIYTSIADRYAEFINSYDGQECLRRFNEALPQYANILSDVRKIDYMLWSKRI